MATAPAASPDAASWRDLVPHTPGVLILDILLFANHLVRLERYEGLPRIVVRDLRDDREWTVKFDEEAYSLGMSAGYEFVDRFTGNLGLAMLTRSIVLEGQDSGLPRGQLTDSQMMLKLGVGFAL